ncbi:hypothetical protein HY732_02145 [Candidatus Uhrbacteria bacterium]|nr:hypothetical protein [Candidatus Uhrbacteria bacterium]
MPEIISSVHGQKKKKGFSRQTILLILFIVILGSGGGYYYLAYFAPQEAPSLAELEIKRQLPIKKVNWQKALYENTIIKGLRNPLGEPLTKGTIGNRTPFQPPVEKKLGL